MSKLILIGIGFLFMANPFYSTIDFFPDVIGCFLILLGLQKISFLFEPFEKARKFFFYLMILSAFQIPLMLITSTLSGSDKVSATLVYSILFIVFFLVALNALHHGINDVFMFSKVERLTPEMTDMLNRSETIKKWSIIFLSIRTICHLLPELIHLQLYDGMIYTFGRFDFSGAYPYLCLVSCLICLCFGIIWAIRVLRFYRDFSHLASIMDPLDIRAAEYEANHPIFFSVQKAERRMTLFVCFVLFALSITVGSSNCFISTVASCFALGFFMMNRSPRTKINIIVSIISIVLTISATIAQLLFNENYTMASIMFGGTIFLEAIEFFIVKLFSSASLAIVFSLMLKDFGFEIQSDIESLGVDLSSDNYARDIEESTSVKHYSFVLWVVFILLQVYDVSYLFFNDTISYFFVLIKYLLDVLVLIIAVQFVNKIKEYPYHIMKEQG